MVYIIKKISGVLLIVLFSFPLFSQQTIKGTTKGIRGTTNFIAIAKFELAHPVKEKIKTAPEEIDEDVIIHNPINNAGIAPFSGNISTVNYPDKTNFTDNVQEAPCLNFNALDDNGGSYPPDVNGAVGFDHLMITLNTQIRIQNKQGNKILTNSLTGFWNGIGGHTDIFDPKITYDPYDKRWFFVCCATRDNANSALLLAVSQTYDPTGNWNTYSIDADPGNQFWFDYPSLGFNRNWITIGGYMFNITGQTNTQRSRVFVINKADAYAGTGNFNIPYFDRTDYFHICPAVTYDPNDNTDWCVSVHNNNSDNNGYVKLFSITGTGSAPVFNVGGTVNVGPAWSGAGVNGPQLNSATGLDLGDDRIRQTMFRNGTIWFSNNVFLPVITPTTCAVQVVSINPGSGLALENIKVAVDNTGAAMSAYPSVTVNQNNDLFFGYSYFTTSSYATAAIAYRRSGQGFFNYIYKGGEDWYVKLFQGKNRWGDYSATFIDPEDDVTAWTIQEYARPRVAGTSYWGTWWAKVCPGSCTNDFTLSGTNNNLMKKYEANNTITSTVQIQSNSFIKYDAGTNISLLPGFRAVSGTKFQAYIEGCGGTRVSRNKGEVIAENSVASEKEISFATMNTLHAYPNPTTSSINLDINLQHAENNLVAEVYDRNSTLVKKVSLGNMNAGNHTSVINLNELSSGIYLVVLKLGFSQLTAKVILAK